MSVIRTILTIAISAVAIAGRASGGLDSIRSALEQGSVSQLQEKVYVHTDNNCYFVGDTLWYKAYVVGAGDLRFTDRSRILYVELLTPDGLVVERQRVIVSPRGFTCGAFALTDSLYSGYYELRAYTRWMLNFNVAQRQYSADDAKFFYSQAMAADFFRTWEGLYSRVFPVYERPDSAGDYTYKRIYQRPKQRLPKSPKPAIEAAFYPEGGHLVEGLPCRVAFELTDQDGAAIRAEGTLHTGHGPTQPIATAHMGRGVFTFVPDDNPAEVRFVVDGEAYSFRLPKAEAAGVALRLDDGRLSVDARGLDAGLDYGLSVLCRGVLRHFDVLRLDAAGHASLTLPPLPTGVNDLTVFDSEGRILADRLFFVNNHDLDSGRVDIVGGADRDYQPYERMDIALQVPTGGATLLSVSVRDTRTDEPSFDTGNIMTDLLLGSELRGFVPDAAYYFAAADSLRRAHLDLLMMVQGWRRYRWQELCDPRYNSRRYEPELTMTVRGGVYAMPDVLEARAEDAEGWRKGQFKYDTEGDLDLSEEGSLIAQANEADAAESSTPDIAAIGAATSAADVGSTASTPEFTHTIAFNQALTLLGENRGGLKREVLVEAELSMGNEVYGIVQQTHDHGLFAFEIPPFYGTAALLMKAYEPKDSIKKGMTTGRDKHAFNEKKRADYYVKRDLDHPMWANPYSYYQCHAPEYDPYADADTLAPHSMERDVHRLRTVDVRGRRRGKRALDRTKPAYVLDAWELYNNITDAGLSFGTYDPRLFPVSVCRYLFGNMGLPNLYNVDARIDNYTYYRNYDPDKAVSMDNAPKPSNWSFSRNPVALFEKLRLSHLLNVRVFTDYEPRELHYPVEPEAYKPLATVEFEPLTEGSHRPVTRDRSMMLQGFNLPADFYSPDYSSRKPAEPTDYRRTLYWNPNALTDDNGRIDITLYNNSKETRVEVSVAGITPEGKIIYR